MRRAPLLSAADNGVGPGVNPGGKLGRDFWLW